MEDCPSNGIIEECQIVLTVNFNGTDASESWHDDRRTCFRHHIISERYASNRILLGIEKRVCDALACEQVSIQLVACLALTSELITTSIMCVLQVTEKTEVLTATVVDGAWILAAQ